MGTSLETYGRGSVISGPVVEARDVWRRFGSRPALRGASLEVGAGEIHALLGPNGAGKTTLLRTLVGLVDPDRGSVRVGDREGAELARPSARRLFGFVPSGDRSFYLRLTGLENLGFFGRLHGLSRREAFRRARESLVEVGLEEAARVPVGVYSHGMQKRLSVARALLMGPPALLVDEATHDLDPEGARRVRRLVRAEAERGVAVLWTTQRVEEIRGFVDRVTLLHEGSVRFSGTVPELVGQGTRRWTVELEAREGLLGVASAALAGLGELGRPPGGPESDGRLVLTLSAGTTLGAALEALVRADLRVINCWQETSEIEEAFLRLTGQDG